MAKPERINLSSIPLSKLEPNLIESHIKSYNQLLEEGIMEIFSEVNPIQDYTGESWELSFTDIEWGDINSSFVEAQKKGLSYDIALYVHVRLLNKKTGEIKKQRIFVADIPLMSDRATFVVNGNERVVVMQIVRSEGVLFFENKKSTPQNVMNSVKLMPLRGRWFDFEMNKYGVMSVKLLDKRPRILLTTLLRAIGYSSDDEIRKALSDVDTGDVKYVENTLKRDVTSNTEEALLDIYRKLRPEDSINLEVAEEFITNLFFNKRVFYLGRTGRYQLNKKLGIDEEITQEDYTLKKKDLVHIVRNLIMLNNGTKDVDDIDSLANRRIRGVGELIGERIRVGVIRMEKNIKDRMSTYSTQELVTPSVFVNTRPVIAAINQFFGSSAVSRYMDQQNPLSELETKRRITAGGPRGLTKERATFSVRDVHSSHYSKLCMVTTPEGTSIGIVSHMAVYSRINDYGFLEAPYFKVYTEMEVNKDNEKKLVNRVLRSEAKDAKGKVIFKTGKKLTKTDVKKLQGKVEKVEILPWVSDEVDYLDADDELSVKTAPAVLEKDEHNNITEENVFVRADGTYTKVSSSLIDYVDINPGQIGGVGFSLIPYSYNDDPTRTLMASNMQRQAVPLVKPKAPIVGTGWQRTVAEASGRAVFAKEDGEVVYSDGGKVIVKYKKAGEEEYFVEKFARTNQNTCFSQTVSVKTGEKFKKGDLLIDGPAMEDGELALGRNVTAAFMVYEGYNYEDGIVVSEQLVKDDVFTSIHIKEYVQDIRETKLGNEQITKDIPNVGEYVVRNLNEDGLVRIGAKVGAQDILVGIIAPKGETELTPEEKLLRAIFGEYARDVRDNSLRMPHGDSGIVIGVQVLDKEKGDKLNPGVLKQVKVWVAKTQKISVGDKLTGLHGDKGVISKILPVEDMPHMEDGTPIDIILSPMFVKRMNIGGIRELETGRLAKALGVKVEVPPFAPIDDENELTKMAKKEGVPLSSKIDLYDGRTGEKFDHKVVVGPRYIVKLDHLSSDKIHARATGSYTMVTQQPLGGKAQFGGQRFGEMEVWALEAHATPHVLHEMLTIKSDDVVGRAAAYKAIIQGTEIEAPNVPESFKVFLSELRALSVNLDLIDADEDDIDMNDIIEGNLSEEDLKDLNAESSEDSSE